MKKLIALVLTLVLTLGLTSALAETLPFEGKTLHVAIRNTGPEGDAMKAQYEAFEAKTGAKIEVEVLAADADEAESVLLIRAATGNLPDVFTTNIGAKMQELDPAANMMDLSDCEWLSNINSNYLSIVSDIETGAVYGTPIAFSNVAGVFYNKEIFANLNLEIPTTWDEFIAACAVIRENGIDPVVSPFATAAGCQLLVLMQYYYVDQEDPEFAAKYTANTIALHESPAYMRGLEKLAELYAKSYINSDPLSTAIQDAGRALAEGTAAMCCNRTNIISSVGSVDPDAVEKIGFFPLPDLDAENRGVTMWMPHAYVVSQYCPEPELAKAFLEYLTTQEAIDVYCSVNTPTGAFMLNGVTLTGDVPSAVAEAQEWSSKASVPAMEYICPIKGANMATILSMVGTGQYTPEQGISEIEMDNEIDAQQKGLAGW